MVLNGNEVLMEEDLEEEYGKPVTQKLHFKKLEKENKLNPKKAHEKM